MTALRSCYPREPLVRRFLVVGFLVCAFELASEAQSAGTIAGVIRDPTGLVIVDSRITISNPSNGIRRELRSGSDGFAASGLPLGNYQIRVEHDGFGPQVQEDVRLAIAERRWIEIVLIPSSGLQRLEVIGRAPLLEADETSLGATISRRDLMSLPINGRDYTRLSLLAPGALTRTNQLADLSFNGLFSVHNQYSIDGVEATRIDQPYVANGLERGARLLTGGLDSIAEFRIHTSTYQAEYGRAASALINIATTTGTNFLRGSAFGYLRNQRLDARNFFNTTLFPKAPFTYTDFGLNVTGPIVRNSTFFSANYEGSRQQLGITGSGTVPSASLRDLTRLTSPGLSALLSVLPQGSSPSSNPFVDFYSTVANLAIREDTGSVKLNQRLSSKGSVYVRVNINDSHVRGPLFGNQPAALGLRDQQDVPVRVTNIAAGGQWLLSATAVNDTLFGVQDIDSVLNTSMARVPLFSIAGVSIQPGDRGSTISSNRSYQFGDTFSLQSGSHSIKTGATFRHQALFLKTAALQLLTFSSLDDFARNNLASAVIVAANPGSRVAANEANVFIQDTWKIARTLTLDYGLRYDLFAAPFDPAGQARPFDLRQNSLAPAGSPFFRTNRRNFAPRFGFAWQIKGGYTLRGGYGMFYNVYPVGFGDLSRNSLPGNTTLLAQLVPGLSYPVDSFLTGVGAALPNVSGFEWHKPDLYTHQWNFFLVKRLGESTMIRAGHIGNRGLHLRRNLNVNLVDSTLGRRPFQGFADVNIETASGKSWYTAAELSVIRSFARRFSGTLNYTWSHAIDDVSDPAVLATSQPQDNRNFRTEKGNGSGDARHRLQASGVFDLPLGRGRFLEGWQLVTTAYLRTGIATTVTMLGNTAGTGNFINQRPDAALGVSPYSLNRGVDSWLNAAAFRRPQLGSFGNLGRGTVTGPPFAQIDGSLANTWRLSRSKQLQCRVDVFNILNHPNFAQPDTVFGSTSFGRIFQTAGNRIGLGTARQIEVSLRLSF